MKALADQVAVETERREEPTAQARDYTYHAGSTNAGRPVYYVVEEDENLHSDRSPYTYEPADTHTSLVADYTHQAYHQQQHSRPRPQGAAQLGQAESGDFVIKEHTYSMCPGNAKRSYWCTLSVISR